MAEFIIGDYKYTTNDTSHTVQVDVNDRLKLSYEDIPATVTYDGVTYRVTDASYCFRGCASLTEAPVIPNSVTLMRGCFENCTSLIQAPIIPNNVIYLGSCFKNCTSLTEAPIIPNRVDVMHECFENCTSLTGNLYILGNPYYLPSALYGTTQPIRVYTFYRSVADALKNSSDNNNIIIQTDASQGDVPITILNTRALTRNENTTYNTSHGIRVDLLVDCSDGGGLTNVYINNSIYSNVLYDMYGNLIPLNGSNSPLYIPPDYLRCYIIIEAPQIVPTNTFSFYMTKVAFDRTSAENKNIYYPSTATHSQILQEGNNDIISPQIDVKNIRVNSKGSGLNAYTVADITGSNSIGMINVQTNVNYEVDDVAIDIKHVVTHASNVKVGNTTTLQDWITNMYSVFI